MNVTRSRRATGLGIAFLLALFVACEKEQTEQRIELPETPIVSIRDRWAVVDDRYVRVREEPRVDASVSDYVRLGLIVEVAEVVDNGNGPDATWMRIAGQEVDGWVTESNLSLYESRARARNAARQIVDEAGASE